MPKSRRSIAIPAQINCSPELPIAAKADDICALIKQHQVLVVAGETGSGKTTQLPKLCLRAGLGKRGLIGHTQPRRLAAVSVANRIAEEMGVDLGQVVGYQIRFDDKSSDASFLKLMTDGILLSEIQHDPSLRKYEALIIDEAHERSLNIDFLLGFLKRLCKKRKDLKIIITSATIDLEKFSRHFDAAPIVKVSGRTFPVETLYRPLDELAEANQWDDDPIINGIIASLKDIEARDRSAKSLSGDVLVFLSSEREIRECALKIRKLGFRDTEVLPLYARLRQSEQRKIFSSHRGRRIVLATNVAETSITVPGIHYVIDSGFARISRYSVRSKVQRLPIEPISQASANQRQGRCGRVANGICIRLYSETDFEDRPEFTDPEIRRTNLASVILQMLAIQLGDIESFPFIDPPQQAAINDGIKLLTELNAITGRRSLTKIGSSMAKFPVDPRYARMLVAANQLNCLHEVAIIVSALCIQDPREFPPDKRQLAQERLAQFQDVDSDFMGFVVLWRSYEKLRQSLSQSKLRKYCGENFLSFMRMREWREIHSQLIRASKQMHFKSKPTSSSSYSDVHKAIISGSLNQIACFSEGREYLSSRNRKLSLFGSSVLARKSSKWIVCGELIETSQIFSSLAAKIQPAWVEEQAFHLVKKSYSEPHWSIKRQQVMAYEKVQLFGLTLIEKQRVSFGRIDPQASYEIFLSEGLAAFQLKTKHRFYEFNRSFLEKLRREEEKLRRPQMIWSDRELINFYAKLVPSKIFDGSAFNQWFQRLAAQAQDEFSLTLARLGADDELQSLQQEFPDRATLQNNDFSVDYQFNPGLESDGATLNLPLAVLGQIRQADVDWAVPGIIEEKCIALVKSLPKALRKNFIPVKAYVESLVPRMSVSDGTVLESLCAHIRQDRGIELKEEDFRLSALPPHLTVKIRVEGPDGKILATSANLQQLKNEFHVKLSNTTTKVTRSHGKPDEPGRADQDACHPLEVSGLKNWTLTSLPAYIEIGDKLKLQRFPALIDEVDSVSVRLLADREEAESAHNKGLLRLYQMRSVAQFNSLKKDFQRLENKLALKLAGRKLELAAEAPLAVYVQSFIESRDIPRDRDSFEASLMSGKAEIYENAQRLEKLLITVVEKSFEIAKRLNSIEGAAYRYLLEDVRGQVERLIYPGFLRQVSMEWLKHYPRYLAAMEYRLSKLPHIGEKDQEHTAVVAGYWDRFRALQQRQLSSRRAGDELSEERFRFMLEELRVSLFAQQLRTSVPVSPKRLDKLLQDLRG